MGAQTRLVKQGKISSAQDVPSHDLSKTRAPKQGLRQRQKAERSELILKIAQEHFETYGFEKTKIEAIAEEVGMSAVTIFNYFNSKAGLLLALVQESDARLIERLQEYSKSQHNSSIEAISKFAQIIQKNATGFLTKALWRQALAANIIDKAGEFRGEYRVLESELKLQLTFLLKTLNEQNQLPKTGSIEQLSETIFTLLIARFMQYVSSEKLLDSDINTLFEADLNLILS